MGKNNKIIICSPQLGISPNSTLGGEVYDREVLSRIANMGARIDIYLPKNREYEKDKKFHVTYAPFKHIIPPYLFGLIMLFYLATKYRKIQFNFLRVHSHFLGPGALIFKIFYPEVKLISHYHLDHKGFLVNFINKLLFKKSDAIIADSLFLKSKLSEKFSNEKGKIVVIHTGVDHTIIKPQKPDKGLIKKYNLKNKVVVTFLGRLISRKNPIFLVYLLKLLPKNSILLIIGDGPEYIHIKKEATRLRLENRIIMPGNLFGENKLKYYSISNIFAFPSQSEGFVLAVLEAMSAGLPLVLPNSGAFGEAVEDGINGFLAKPNDKADWARKLTKLINDKKLREKMGRFSRQKVIQSFTWEKVAKKNLAIYKRLS